MAFYVVREEADDISIKYSEYMDQIQSLRGSLKTSVAAFSNLDDSVLGGEAGTSMKNYMGQVHDGLIDNISALVSQLMTDYVDSYLSKLQTPGEGIYETGADNSGKYPTSKLNTVSSDLKNIQTGDLSNAVADLNKAKLCIPEGISFSFPSESRISTILENQSAKAITLKTNVENAENAGKTTISSGSGTLGDLCAKVNTTITHYESEVGPITSYESGSFGTFVTAIGLRESYKAAVTEQGAKKDVVLTSTKKSIECKQKRIEKKKKEEAKKKAGWLIFGTFASAGVAIAGICAVVATGGMATPLIIACVVSSGKDLLDVKNRVDQLKEVSSGDYMAQKEDNPLGFASDAKSAVKVADSGLKLEDAQDAFESGGEFKDWSKVVGEQSGSLTATVGKKFVSEIFDGIKGSTDDPAAQASIDILSEFATESIDAYKDYVFGGSVGLAGPVGTLCKCGTIVADYGASQCDEKLAALDSENSQLDDLSKNFGNNWNTSTAVNW